MAMIDVPGLVVPPHFERNGSLSQGIAVLDAAGEMQTWICRAPKTGNIHKVHIRTGSSMPTATDTDVRIETVDLSTGFPSGTLWGTNTNVVLAAAAFIAASFVEATLTADAAVTRGDLLAVVVVPTGTPNMWIVAGWVAPVKFPHTASFASGAWAASSGHVPMIGLEYDDGSFAEIQGAFPPATESAATINISTTTNPDEVALKFKCSRSVRVSGAWLFLSLNADFDLVLYDSDGATPLATLSWDSGVTVVATAGPYWFAFDTSVVLNPNEFYYLAVKPTTTTALIWAAFDVSTIQHLDQLPGGQDFHWAQRVDGGSWSPNTSRRPMGGLVLDGVEPES